MTACKVPIFLTAHFTVIPLRTVGGRVDLMGCRTRTCLIFGAVCTLHAAIKFSYLPVVKS